VWMILFDTIPDTIPVLLRSDDGSSIDVNGLSRDERSILGSQEDIRRPNLNRSSYAAIGRWVLEPL
jgi:hypothetical protein